jgi:phage terminase large subunit-like protein
LEAPVPRGGKTPAISAWWGDGPPPTERWSGVTIALDERDGKYRFAAAAADKVCAFFPRYCSHSKGEFAGKPFEPLDYQRQLILRPLFGWVRVTDGFRRFQKAYIQIPKKNGKTQLIAGLGLYMLLCDNEPGAEVYVAAADREQARILFEAAKAMVESNAALNRRCVIYRNQIKRADDPTAFFQVLSSEAKTKHGPNIHCLIIDELHAQPDRDLYETLTRGVIGRRQPLILEITTAGDDDESICFEEYEYAKRVLSGTVEDDAFLPVIFEASDKDDWTSPDVWARVNPGLGVTIRLDKMEGFAREAINEPRKRNDFLRYNLNRWVNQATAWIPVEWWDACDSPMPSDEELRQFPCAVGIDMAQKIDLASAVAAFRLPLEQEPTQPDELEVVAETDAGEVVRRRFSLDFRVALVPAFWLPEETLEDHVKKDRVPYDQWREQDLLRVVDGAILGADPIVDYLAGEDGKSGLVKRFPRLKGGQFAYDPAFATEIALALRDGCGLTVVEVLQNYKHLSEACQVFEALVKARRILHGGHRLLRWNLENVAIKHDDAGRIRPVKSRKAAKRIDGVVAAIMAISRLMLIPPERRTRRRTVAKMWTPNGFVPVLEEGARAEGVSHSM